MGLLETLNPNELLGFFIELTKTETEEKQWEVWLHKVDSIGFDEFKKKTMQQSKQKLSSVDEKTAIKKANNILKIKNFKEVGG